MTNSSRIMLAKELLHCARMVLDAPCLMEVNSLNIKYASNSAKVRDIVLKFDESHLEEDAEKWKARASANVIHHMRGEKKYIGVDTITGIKLDEIRCALGLTSSNKQTITEAKKELQSGKYDNTQIKEIEEISKSIRQEISNCVLISSEFHNWLSGRIDYTEKTLTYRRTYDLKTREDYYKLYHKFLADKTCIKKVTKCSFSDNSLIDAISSICRLKGCINDDLNINSDELINELNQLFDKISKAIKDNNILKMPSNEGT